MAVLALSQKGEAALIELEGEVLTAYQDATGTWTIGVGVIDREYAFPGNTITKKKSRELLKKEVQRISEGISPFIKVPLTQLQQDAVLLLSYNIGITAFKNSTLLKMLNAGDYLGAADQFLRWDKATVDGKKIVLPGLKRRRAKERAMFLDGTDIQATDDEFESNIEAEAPKKSVDAKNPGVLGTGAILGAGGLKEILDALSVGAMTNETTTYIWLVLGALALAFVIYKSRKDD